MSRGASKAAMGIVGNANAAFGEANQRAGQVYNDLFPSLYKESTNPTGFSAPQLASMNTANQQSIGGDVAGVQSKDINRAARTRNLGGQSAALDSAARAGGRLLSQNALGIQNQNAELAQKKQQAGIAGLENLYSENERELSPLLNSGTNAVNAWTEADKATQAAIQGDIGMAVKMGTAAATGGMGDYADMAGVAKSM